MTETSTTPLRIFAHIDMDAFFASVEQRDDPDLRDAPVVVGGRAEDRGVVAAASYEARQYGIRSAISMAEAFRRCPELIRLNVDIPKYREVSRQVMDVFRSRTGLIEPVSLDEAYLDISETLTSFAEAESFARELKVEIRERTELTASVGVAPCKFAAKIASDYDKPDGLCVIRPEELDLFLAPLNARVIPGVGPKTGQRLAEEGLETIEDLRLAGRERLVELLGPTHGARLHELAHGRDERPVVVSRIRKSVSRESTFRRDVRNVQHLVEYLSILARKVYDDLTRLDLHPRHVGIKVRFSDFSTLTRGQTLPEPVCTPDGLLEEACKLLQEADLDGKRVRLLGLRTASFIEHEETEQVRQIDESLEAKRDDRIQPLLWDTFADSL